MSTRQIRRDQRLIAEIREVVHEEVKQAMEEILSGREEDAKRGEYKRMMQKWEKQEEYTTAKQDVAEWPK